MRWRVNFFDKHSDETRSFTVEAQDEDSAEIEGEKEADKRQWPKNFKVSDAVEIGYAEETE